MKEPKGKKPAKVAKPKKKLAEVDPYVLPRGCKEEDVLSDIKRYFCFEFEDRVYMIRNRVAEAVSNFTCAIRMHINGEQPTRLIAIRNDEKSEKVMHVPHDVFNALATFKKTVTSKGNYQWRGSEPDYQRYLWMMMDKMGVGRMLLEPGMQTEGFWAFCNKIIDGQELIDPDEFGCFELHGRTYYMPTAHTDEDTDDDTGTSNSRRVVYMESPVTFGQLSKQQRLVHGGHSFLAQVHAVGTVFSDIIRDRVEGFPVPFYYGKPGTGKDQIIKTNQRLFGKPQRAIRLHASNTAPAIVNVFAEFRNVPLYLTEWSSGLREEMHVFVMGIWDGEGRRRGQRIQAGRSRYGTEDIPIRCTASVSGNEYPNHLDQLLDRLVVTEMKPLVNISSEQRTAYRELGDLNKRGYSYLMRDIVKHREAFAATWFETSYQIAADMVNVALGSKHISERMRANITTLVSVHHFFTERLDWAFTTDELTAWLVDAMLKQQKRRLSGDEISEFWTCFIAAINAQQLRQDKHFKLDAAEGAVAFYWPHVQPLYMEHHRRIFGTPGKRDILGKLQEHHSFIRGSKKLAHEGYRIGKGKSTAYLFDVHTIGPDLIGLLQEDTVDAY